MYNEKCHKSNKICGFVGVDGACCQIYFEKGIGLYFKL